MRRKTAEIIETIIINIYFYKYKFYPINYGQINH